jgi:2-polyprenyl-6-methoxyphenol hydroxylase-like FAD-dependent oxidoreductase
MSDDYDVAVVGYGPTGMSLAALLGRLGHRVIVLERYTGLYNLPRAACFDDEIMRVFQKLGIAKEIGRGARPQYEYDWVNSTGKTLVKLEYEKIAPGGWAALYMMFQPHIEAVLDSYDRALPTVDVCQGVTVSDVVQDPDFVRNTAAWCSSGTDRAVGRDGVPGRRTGASGDAVDPQLGQDDGDPGAGRRGRPDYRVECKHTVHLPQSWHRPLPQAVPSSSSPAS